jgi:alpha-methylacyl-CoA racemase
MVLADLGAEVIRVERPAAASPESDPPPDPLQRGRARSVAIDLKHPYGRDVLLRLVERCDVLIEGFRPGVMERLGVGPDECLQRNPRLVYGRLTGWGQEGSRATTAGHDIDYLGVAGALHPIGPAAYPPPPPLNLVADFGGGGMLLALGVCAALVARGEDGPGDVIDAAMLDGAALLTTMFHGLVATGGWSVEREDNLLDGGAPFYRTYATADGRYVAVGAIEPQFYAALIDGLGLGDAVLPGQYDRSGWPDLAARFSEVFGSQTRDHWAGVFDGTDACVVPVLDLVEARADDHVVARGTFVEIAGIPQPAPAPRFAERPLAEPTPPRPPGADADAVLEWLGYDEEAIGDLRRDGVVV